MANFWSSKRIGTQAIHASHDPDSWTHLPIVPPIVTAATFNRRNREIVDDATSFRYSRFGNPTRDSLEKCLATLEGAKHGLTFAAGMGAVSSVTQLLSSGDRLVCCDNVYSGTPYYFTTVAERLGIHADMVDGTNLDSIRKAIKPNTKLIWIESPTNPSLQVLDISAIHKIAKASKILLVVDNTFLTPYFQRPLELGADIVVYSLAKYMNGHSDVIMGAALTNDDDLFNRLRLIQIVAGNIPSPFDCYQVIRGLKTLAVRMKQHNHNALAVAQYLESHPNITKVIHPGLPSHPQYELAQRQSSGHSGMVSFYLKGGATEAKNFLKELKVFGVADSLGGVESLVEIPSLMSHNTLPPDTLKTLEITDNFVRASVGIEDEADLLDDLKHALQAAYSK